MKAITLKSLLGILVLGSMFNLSCNQNSPAPVTPAAPNTSSATTSTTTPEGLALALVGHWYLDSIQTYITPVSFGTQYYGYNYVFPAPNGGTAIHYEGVLKTSTVTAPATTNYSYMRNCECYTWSRNAPAFNDTSSFGANTGFWQVIDQQTNGFLFLQGGCTTFFNGYVRNINTNSLILSGNDASIKSGQWSYWHR